MPEGALMICDAEKQIGIAGVMGGLNSEITEDTKTVILEVANFNGDSIRSTSKKLALRTEASSRYEKESTQISAKRLRSGSAISSNCWAAARSQAVR